jgi:hypothetical protein
MNPNKCSHERRERPPGSPPDRWAALEAVVDDLAAQDRDRLTDAALAEGVLRLRRLLDRLEGQWLQHPAAVDGRGAAAATSAVRTARALFRGPLSATAQALCDGELSAAHASALAHGTHHLPTQVTAQAEPVLVDAARHLDPPRLRRAVGHLVQTTDPDAAGHQGERRHGRRGVWWATPWTAWSPSKDCWSLRPARP